MININSLEDLDNFIINNQDKIVMLYFGAIWCQPCKKLKTRLESDETEREMPNLSYCYIDIDNEENNEICKMYKVKLLPTLVFIKLDKDLMIKILGRVDGYDWIKIVMTYNEIKN
jgi:thiol-disulfide isomerase/thioredoxin